MSDMKSRILAAQDQRCEQVTVDEWGGLLEVRGMNGNDRRHAEALMVEDKLTYADLIIPCLYDPESGARIFDAADRDQVNAKSGAVLSRLAMIGMRLSGLVPVFDEAAGTPIADVEAGKDDSPPTLSNSSATGLPSDSA